MPSWISVILLGIIEGLTEFVPVSSTGHLLIAEQWLPRQSDLFNVVIQSGAVLAVLPLFSARCRNILQFRNPDSRDYLLKLLLAFGITGAGGLVLEKLHFKLPDTSLPVGLALFVGGVLFIAVELWLRQRRVQHEVSWAVAVAVGLGQLLAVVFPGASRSGTTILLALLLGLSRPAATEFCFLVGIPTLVAAGGFKILKQLSHGASEDWGLLALATLVAALVSFAVVKWFLRYVQSHNFVGFGVYRIALGLAILAFL